MDRASLIIGEVFCFVGGIAIGFLIIVILIELTAEVFIAASNKWRGIIQAESLIYEYRKNRKEFLQWKDSMEGKDK